MTQPKSSASSQATGNGSTKLQTPPVTRATSPYGTRSRNRGAANRVNYAEDKDNEMEYEYTNTTTSSTSTSAAASTSQSGGNTTVNGGSGRRASAAVMSTGKEVAITAHGSKKRKNTFVQAKERISNMYSFENPFLKDGVLTADDGTTFTLNEHIYLICEPPGEPYYLARIMEFLHTDNNPTKPIDSLRVNWYYRPKDIHRKVTDSRTIFASMHSDTCPLTSIRGKCTIEHKNMIDDIDEFRKQQNHFWYDKLFDRYIQRFYEVIPTRLVLNVPEKIRKVLQDRWKFVLVEPQRAKELCSAMKECKRCNGYCASADSVHCAVCGNSYHMNCVRPPLLKKPSRGFAWACGPCNRSNERRLEARNTPTQVTEAEEELAEDEDEEMSQGGAGTGDGTPAEMETAHQPTEAQLALARQWPYRYLGMHCKVEDVLDFDDRIYPMAASRLGSRHQANVPEWYGRPVEYVKPVERKRYEKGRRKDAKTAAALAEADRLEKEKRPKWIMDEPVGYVKRGADDSTASLLFRISEDPEDNEDVAKMEIREKIIDDYMEKAKELAKSVGVEKNATNFLDKALQLLYQNHLKIEPALRALKAVDKKKDLKEPEFKGEELKRFEEGVTKYGSELHDVCRHVRTKKMADIVRFYYMWKKTPRGKEIWGGYEGRRAKKEAKKQEEKASTKLVDEFADDVDDSAFDESKASQRKRGFQCKFCLTKHSRQWRRAPGVPPGTTVPVGGGSSKHSKKEDKDKVALVLALCYRCGELWRRYGLQWEDPDEIMKKLGQGGGRAWKRRIDEELLKEIAVAAEEKKDKERGTPTSQVGGSATPTVASSTVSATVEPPKKKQKTTETVSHAKKVREKPEKKEVAQPPPPPPPPEPPKPKVLTCMICLEIGPEGERHLCCRDCKMTVHRTCYGVGNLRSANKWVCDMCMNDKNPQTSTCYECVLCPIRGDSDDEEPEKVKEKEKEKEKPASNSHKKKEKEKIGHAGSDRDERRMKDVDKHKPRSPREALKSTAGNNWVHVTCAVWTPEIKFGDANSLSPAEGIGLIPQSRHQQVCTVCKTSKGACVACHQCHVLVHIGCAQKAGYTFGFDIQPVKGSRRDLANTVNTVKVGNESGSMSAALWCPEHEVKTKVHAIDEKITEEQTALQLYVSTYKQADLTLTGTVRKASLITQSTKASQSSRRTSIVSPVSHTPTAPVTRSAIAAVTVKSEPTENGMEPENEEDTSTEPAKKCHKCGVDVSPLWQKVKVEAKAPQINGAGPQSPLPNGNGHAQGSRASSISSLAAPSPSATPHTNGEVHQLPSAKVKFARECHKCHWKALHEPTPPPPPPAPPAPPQPVQSVQHTPPVVTQPSPRLSQIPPAKPISLSPPVYQPALSSSMPQIPPITPITSQIPPQVPQQIPPPVPVTVATERPALPIHPSHHSPPFLPQHHSYPPVGQGTQLPPIKGALSSHGPGQITPHGPQQPPPISHVHSLSHSVSHGPPHLGSHTGPHSGLHSGPQHPAQQHHGPHIGTQHPGHQHSGPQHPGPQHPGPQHPQHPGPQHPQHPQHSGPQHSNPHAAPHPHSGSHSGPHHVQHSVPHSAPQHSLSHSGPHSGSASGHGPSMHGSPPVQSVPHTPQQGYSRPSITSPHHSGSMHSHGSPHGVVSLPRGSPPHSAIREIRHTDMRHNGSPQHSQGHMSMHHPQHPMHSSSSLGHAPPQPLPQVPAPHPHQPSQTLAPYHGHHSNPQGPMHQPIGHHGPLHPQHHVHHPIHPPQPSHREHSQSSHSSHPPMPPHHHQQHPPPQHQTIQHIKREEPPTPQPTPPKTSTASSSASLANLLH